MALKEQFIRVRMSAKKPKAKRSHGYLMSKLGRSLGRGGGLLSFGSKRSFVREPKTRTRRVIVKAFILKNHQNGGAWAEKRQKHAHYIGREGVSQERTKGVTYGPGSEPLDVSNFLERGQKDPHEFRFVLSAEDASSLDLTEFTKTWMRSLEKDFGTKLDWMASNHYNTDSPHTHIVLRGVDQKGHPLILDRDTITRGIRNRACEIVTRELGARTVLEIEHEIKNSVSKTKVTQIDFEISKRIDLDGFYTPQNGPKIQGVLIPEIYQEQRLSFLETQGLAQKVSERQWKLPTDLVWQLKERGQQEDIIRMMHREAGASEQNCVIYQKEVHGQKPLNGVVVYRGISNEMTDKEFLVIKEQYGPYYYIDLEPSSKPSQVQVGHFVQVSLTKPTPWVKKSDLNLAEFTSSSHGIYDEKKHQAWAKSVGISSQDYVKVHVNRLEFLEKLDLAQKQVNGQWKLIPNFLKQLERLEQEHRKTFKPRLQVGIDLKELRQELKVQHGLTQVVLKR